MKYLLITFSALIICLSAFSKNNIIKPDGTAVLQKLMTRLNSLKAISYTYKSIFDYPTDGYHHESVSSAYFEFDPAAQYVGFKYQVSDSSTFRVYNGSEMFDCDKKAKTIAINNFPNTNSFIGLPPLINSVITLKNALPGILKDAAISKNLFDTVINKKTFYVARFILQNKTLSGLGNYDATTINLNFSYKIIIDKSTYLPYEVLQQTLNNKDTNTSIFTEINTSPAAKTENSWYSSSYEGYAIEAPRKKIEPIKPGVQAPDNHLINFISQQPASISDFKGKVVLIEFWIKDCGHCIEEVPNLNAINTKYKDKNFKLLAVNATDTKKMIDVFMSKHPLNYDLFTADKEISKSYGVNAFPMIVLIDKQGKVIYAKDGLNDKEVQNLIDQNI